MAVLNNRIAVRVDSSIQIGTGHFMRCLVLADALIQRGAQVRFISRELPVHLRDMLLAKSIEFELLDSNIASSPVGDIAHSHWLRVSQEQDAADSIRALSDREWDWIIVDHYALDARWESALRGSAKRGIMSIDDLADRPHNCDVLLDQNQYADMEARYIGKVPARCLLLLGPHYALLRDDFLKLHEQAKPRIGGVKKILVFFGGVDADNYTGCAIEALTKIIVAELHVDVVIGEQHPCLEKIKLACTKYGFMCHVQTHKMAELMAAADLAIGAGGSTTWERCCLGLPTLTICTADNQRKQIDDAALEGLLYAPELHGNLITAIERHLSAVMENCNLMRAISHKGIMTVDGRGKERVIARLNCGGIEVRAARPDDSEKLFEWRNDLSIRLISRSHEPISREEHQSWYTSVMNSDDKILLIGRRDGLPIGVVRYDILNDEADISIYLVPGKKQSGLGRELLACAENWLAAHRPQLKILNALVLGGNARSHSLFKGFGYNVDFVKYKKFLLKMRE